MRLLCSHSNVCRRHQCIHVHAHTATSVCDERFCNMASCNVECTEMVATGFLDRLKKMIHINPLDPDLGAISKTS